jgi:hypothetical protein
VQNDRSKLTESRERIIDEIKQLMAHESADYSNPALDALQVLVLDEFLENGPIPSLLTMHAVIRFATYSDVFNITISWNSTLHRAETFLMWTRRGITDNVLDYATVRDNRKTHSLPKLVLLAEYLLARKIAEILY